MWWCYFSSHIRDGSISGAFHHPVKSIWPTLLRNRALILGSLYPENHFGLLGTTGFKTPEVSYVFLSKHYFILLYFPPLLVFFPFVQPRSLHFSCPPHSPRLRTRSGTARWTICAKCCLRYTWAGLNNCFQVLGRLTLNKVWKPQAQSVCTSGNYGATH